MLYIFPPLQTVAAPAPIVFQIDGVSTNVNIDTGTPETSVALPVGNWFEDENGAMQVYRDSANENNSKPLPTGLYYVKDGVIEAVNKDTVTAANTRALPVELVSVDGIEATLNITTGDLGVEISHDGFTHTWDSTRIGDGTNLLIVNASGQALVKAAELETAIAALSAQLPATLGSKADAAALAVTQSTEDKAALAALSAKLPAALGSDVDANSLTVTHSTEDKAAIAALSAKTHENAIDPNNSTIVPLGISATYTGTATDVTHFASVSIQLFSDEDSAVDGMQFQFSIDGVNWDEVNSFNLDTAISGTRRFQFPVTAQWFRVVYINGTTAQAAFRVQTILHTTEILTSIHRIDTSLTNDRSVLVTKSVIAGETSAGGGGFVNVKVNATGALEVNCVGPEVKDFLDSGVVDTSGTNILTTGTSVVASLASGCQSIEVVDDIGEYMSLRDGAGTVLSYLPLGGGLVKVMIAAGTNIKLYSETGSTISVGKIAINFLGS